MRSAVKRSGFTLIEVLITLVILSTGIVLVLEAFQTSITALGISRDSMWSNILIKEKFAELRANELENEEFQIAPSSGDFGEPYQKYSWSMDVEYLNVPSANDEPAGSLRMVTVTAWRKGMRRTEELSTYERDEGENEK